MDALGVIRAWDSLGRSAIDGRCSVLQVLDLGPRMRLGGMSVRLVDTVGVGRMCCLAKRLTVACWC